MPDIIVHIQLPDSISTDHARLNEEMGKRGFTRRVQSARGTWYDLPSDMYLLLATELDVRAVRDMAKDAGRAVAERVWVFAMEYGPAAWLLHASDEAA